MDFDKILWGDKIIQALYEDPDLNLSFDRSLEAVARSQGGNKIQLPSLAPNGSIVQTDNKKIGIGLPLSVNDTSEGNSILAIYEYTYGPVNIRNLKVVQLNLPLLQKYTAEITQAFKEHIFTKACENVIANVDAAHKIPWTGGVGGVDFTFANLQSMAAKLDDAKILQDNRYCAIPTAAKQNLSADANLTNWFAVNQQAVQEGKLPNLSGFGFIPSTLVPLTKADGTIDALAANNTKKNVVAWRKNHLNLVVQTEMEITGSEDAKYLGFVAAFTVRYGLLLERTKGAVQATQQ